MRELHHEVELGVVVGRAVARVTPAEHAANYQVTRDALAKGKARKPAAKKAKPKK